MNSDQNGEVKESTNVDAQVAFRIGMMRLNSTTEELILVQSSLHEARSEVSRLQNEMRESYELTNAEMARLTQERDLAQRTVREMLQENEDKDGGSDDASNTSEESRSS